MSEIHIKGFEVKLYTFKNFLNIYEEYVSHWLYRDFKIRETRKKKSTYYRLKEIYRFTKSMNMDCRAFIDYCFEESKDIYIPHPERMKHLINFFNLDHKPSYLLKERIPNIVERTIEEISQHREDLIELYFLLNVNPFLVASDPNIIILLRIGKFPKQHLVNLKQWQKIVVAYLILREWKSLKEAIEKTEWIQFIEKERR